LIHGHHLAVSTIARAVSRRAGTPHCRQAYFKEKADIKKALRYLRFTHDIKLIISRTATLIEIEKHLKTGVHILHYIGHSEFYDRRLQKNQRPLFKINIISIKRKLIKAIPKVSLHWKMKAADYIVSMHKLLENWYETLH